MGEETSRIFKTKTGTCQVTREKLVLTRSGLTGNAARGLFGNSITRALVLYGTVGFAALVYAVIMILSENYGQAVLFGLIGVYFAYNVFASFKNSATPEIERSEVKNIVIHSPRPPLTRAYFVVHFVRDGKSKKRLIVLPGSMSDGNIEYENALSILQNEGWTNG